MKKKWKKVLATICVASILVTMPVLTVLADELQVDYAESVVEDWGQSVEDASELDVEYEESDEAASALEITEEVVGDGDITVGDGVTATFDSSTGTIELSSDGGILSHTWISDSKINPDKIKYIRIASGPVYFPEDSSVMFSYCKSLKEVDLRGVNTSRVTDMSGMFSGCTALESLNLEGFDTSHVTNMWSMFEGCSSLLTLDVSRFNTTQVTDMGYMFTGCSKLENLFLNCIDTSFDTSNVTNMDYMFAYCSGLITLDVTGFNTSKVTNMRALFQKCSKVEELNLSSFDLSSVRFYSNMFDSCQALRLLRTPKKNGLIITLPQALYDRNGITYLRLPTKSVIISTDLNYFSIVRGDNNFYEHSINDFYTEDERASGNTRYQTAYDYRLLGDLDRDKDNAEYNAIIDQLNSHWEGSCFGASASMALNNLGVITLGEGTYYDLRRPRESILLRDVINYYTCYQYRNDFSATFVASSVPGSSLFPGFISKKNFLKMFVKEAKTSQEQRKTFLFGYTYHNNQEHTEGHTVVVCGYDEEDYDADGNSDHKIKIYDLNYRDDYLYMYVKSDYSEFQFIDGNHNDLNTSWSSMRCYGIDNLKNADYFKLSGETDVHPIADPSTEPYVTLILDTGVPFILINDQGKSLSYDGSYLGDLDICSMGIIGDTETALKIQVSPSDSFKVKGIDGDFSISVEIDGHYYRASTSGADEIFFSKDEGIVLDGDGIYSFEAALDADIKDYSLVEVSSSASGKVNVINPDDSITLDSDMPCKDIVVTYMDIKGSTEDVIPEETDHFNIFEDDGKIKYGDGINIAKTTILGVESTYQYNGNAIRPDITVMLEGNMLKKDRDYSVEYLNNVNAGTAIVKIKGIGAYEGNKIAKFSIVKKAEKGFSDVQDPSHPYYKAIYWAADAGITKGYDDGTFGINRSCTRGEMMMFLWRYAGKPAPKNVSKSPFKDVPKTHTFYKAILWGSQKGITKGYSDGTFGINRNVSRGECMMFLWRLKGKPAPKAVAKAPFPDVPKSHVFYNAVLWGYQKKITTGFTSGKLKGKFGVNENCSRGQIVTFLYRAK